ncbi:TPA: hypothetical protein U2B00_001128, partial [Streptococcus suis]|nr:hypothetical protein [Streptococcus suis]
MKCNECNRVQ